MMREYGKVSPRFWIETAKQIKNSKLGPHAQLIALYLQTCPSSTMLGIYYLPLVIVAHETGLSINAVRKALKGLCEELNYCSYDEEMEYVWVHAMALEQIGGPLKPGDNRIKGINENYESLPNLTFLRKFYDTYKDTLLLGSSRESRSPSQAPSKPLTSPFEGASKALASPLEAPSKPETEAETGTETGTEAETEAGKSKNVVARTRPSSNESDISTVFEHWKTTMQHANAVLDSKRKALIQKSLQAGYSVTQLCEAITGCSYTPHNIGDNDRGQRYDGLHVILRDADQIDRFINNFHHPPRVRNAAEKKIEANVAVAQRWLSKKITEEDCDYEKH